MAPMQWTRNRLIVVCTVAAVIIGCVAGLVLIRGIDDGTRIGLGLLLVITPALGSLALVPRDVEGSD